MKNRLCHLLEIRYPIVQGAMQWLARPGLAAAVSEAGGLGIITAATFSTGEELSAAITEMRRRTSRPFAVNVSLLPGLAGKEKIDEYMQVILAEKPPVVETAGKSPEEYLPQLRQAGLRVIHKVPSLRFARKAVELGVDAVTVVGCECGGHPGNGGATTLVQIARAARELSVPLIAGGGIADGAGLAAALCLGADGIVMGTRFIASRECEIHPAFQKAVVDATEEDTVLVQRSLGIPLRVRKNAASTRVLELEAQGAGREEIFSVINGSLTKSAYISGDVEHCAFPMGQCAGLIHEVLPVAEIVRRMVEQAADVLKSAGVPFQE